MTTAGDVMRSIDVSCTEFKSRDEYLREYAAILRVMEAPDEAIDALYIDNPDGLFPFKAPPDNRDKSFSDATARHIQIIKLARTLAAQVKHLAAVVGIETERNRALTETLLGQEEQIAALKTEHEVEIWRIADDASDKVLAMTDEQIQAACRLEGRDPKDAVRIMDLMFENAAISAGFVKQTERLVALKAERDAIRKQAIQECATVSDTEEIPVVGGMPANLIAAVLAQDTVMIERAIIGAVLSTKKAISKRIRALAQKGKEP